MARIASQDVAEIDGILRSYPWMDCEIYSWIRGDLTIIAGVDLHGPSPDLLFHFEDTLVLVAPREWKTDTSSTVFSTVVGEMELKVRHDYRVGPPHAIFQFQPEDSDRPCWIAARAVQLILQRPPKDPVRHPKSWTDGKD